MLRLNCQACIESHFPQSLTISLDPYIEKSRSLVEILDRIFPRCETSVVCESGCNLKYDLSSSVLCVSCTGTWSIAFGHHCFNVARDHSPLSVSLRAAHTPDMCCDTCAVDPLCTAAAYLSVVFFREPFGQAEHATAWRSCLRRRVEHLRSRWKLLVDVVSIIFRRLSQPPLAHRVFGSRHSTTALRAQPL